MKWFTSDLHLRHRNIIEYCNRPFKMADGQYDIDLMDKTLAANWDAVVRPGDEVYVLGDICFDPLYGFEWIRKRPGQKFLVWGNHDPSERKSKDRAMLAKAFVKTGDIMKTKVGDQLIVMCHFPMLRWDRAHFGSWMLHGHTHGELIYPFEGKILDVGVDAWGMQLASFDAIKKTLDTRAEIKHHYYREI